MPPESYHAQGPLASELPPAPTPSPYKPGRHPSKLQRSAMLKFLPILTVLSVLASSGAQSFFPDDGSGHYYMFTTVPGVFAPNDVTKNETGFNSGGRLFCDRTGAQDTGGTLVVSRSSDNYTRVDPERTWMRFSYDRDDGPGYTMTTSADGENTLQIVADHPDGLTFPGLPATSFGIVRCAPFNTTDQGEFRVAQFQAEHLATEQVLPYGYLLEKYSFYYMNNSGEALYWTASA
ncbi:hypothetical protein C8R46DRAFT_1224305 [Mycena filopes]|nr:hypothetical protein C8R46DRAFT_1224305 [Mycena filopes]